MLFTVILFFFLVEFLFRNETFPLEKIKFIRPATGIQIKYLDLVLNKKIKYDLRENDFIKWKDLEK